MNVFGYIKRHGSDGVQALALEADKTNERKHYKLMLDGWKFIIDNNFPSLDYAYEVMQQGVIDDDNEEVHAYRDYCRCCGWYAPVSKVVGQRWDHKRDKAIIFNGRACDQCIQDFISVKFEGRNMTPREADNIQSRRFLKKEGSR